LYKKLFLLVLILPVIFTQSKTFADTEASNENAQRLEVFNNAKFSIGVSGWISSGETHTELKSTVDEITSFAGFVGQNQAGDKVSDLLWEDVDSNIVQFDAEVTLSNKFFLYADVGIGSIEDLKLTDDDFLGSLNGNTRVELSHTVNGGSADDLSYVNIHLGREIIRSQDGKSKLRGFLGYQHWNEKLVSSLPVSECTQAFVDCVSSTNLAFSGDFITYDYSFNSIKLGLDGEFSLFNKFKVFGAFSYLPLASLDAEDFHHLRDDAASPFVNWDGDGDGYNLDVGVNYEVFSGWKLSAGYRYWKISSDKNDTTFHFADGTDLSDGREIDFDVDRSGFTLGLNYIF